MMITKLTKAQEAKFPEFVKKWTDIGLSTEPLNREKVKAALDLAYGQASKKSPRVVFCTSPLAVAVSRSVIASVRESVLESVRDSVGDSVRDSVIDSVRASVRESV